MTSTPEEAVAASPRRSALRWAQLALGVLFVAFAAREIWRQLGPARDTISFVPQAPMWLVAATLLVLANYLVLVEAWRRVLLAWDAPVPYGAAARVWFVSNLGKYVPGKVWQLTAMTVMLRTHGVSTLVAGAAAVIVTLGNVAAGFSLAAGFGGARVLGAAMQPALVGLVVVGLALLLLPVLAPHVFRLIARVRGREHAGVHVPRSAAWWAFGGCGLGWLMSGLAFRWFAHGMLGDVGGDPLVWIAAYSGSYLLGYIAPFAIGGLGVRELALTTALPALGLTTPAEAALLTIASRLWLTVLEVAPGVAYLLAGRRAPR